MNISPSSYDKRIGELHDDLRGERVESFRGQLRVLASSRQCERE